MPNISSMFHLCFCCCCCCWFSIKMTPRPPNLWLSTRVHSEIYNVHMMWVSLWQASTLVSNDIHWVYANTWGFRCVIKDIFTENRITFLSYWHQNCHYMLTAWLSLQCQMKRFSRSQQILYICHIYIQIHASWLHEYTWTTPYNHRITSFWISHY